MEFTDREPIYRQIANDLRRQILAEALAEGDRIMSTNEYAAAYRINPATAAKAFSELVAHELVERRRGIGMFVKEGARQRLVDEGREHYIADTLTPAVEAGLALGLTSEEIAAQVQAIVSADHKEAAK
ncbi:MAG: GntR family transcriptional regulator [Gulosibacter sp.]|uniref:GntR family transcriptional regulator n=1 Tax=Gulosibacter sp. TaxID=2817531 RepID=UPI003F901EEC